MVVLIVLCFSVEYFALCTFSYFSSVCVTVWSPNIVRHSYLCNNACYFVIMKSVFLSQLLNRQILDSIIGELFTPSLLIF